MANSSNIVPKAAAQRAQKPEATRKMKLLRSPDDTQPQQSQAACCGMCVDITGHEMQTSQSRGFFTSSKKIALYTLRSRVQGNDKEVNKRYSDFVDLFGVVSQLWETHCKTVENSPEMPELPAGGIMSFTSSNIDEDFIVRRQEALQKWIKEVVWNLDFWATQKLSDKVLEFLQATELVAEAKKKSKSKRRRMKINYDVASEMESYW